MAASLSSVSCRFKNDVDKFGSLKRIQTKGLLLSVIQNKGRK